MEIFVIRHTQVATGKEICYGQSNVPLADTFFQEAEQFKINLPSDFDAVFCSPMQRCIALADELKLNPIILNNSLSEMNFGNWENKKWNEINEKELTKWMTDFVNVQTPNGENLLELYERVKLFMDEMRNKEYKKILLITHAGVIRCLWSYFLKIPLKNIFKIPVDYNEIFICNLANNQEMDQIKQKK